MPFAQGAHLHSVDKIFIGRAPHDLPFQFSFAHGVANGWRHAAVRLAAKLAAYRIATTAFARTLRQRHALPSPRSFAEIAKRRAPRHHGQRHRFSRLFLVARFGRSPFRSRSHQANLARRAPKRQEPPNGRLLKLSSEGDEASGACGALSPA